MNNFRNWVVIFRMICYKGKNFVWFKYVKQVQRSKTKVLAILCATLQESDRYSEPDFGGVQFIVSPVVQLFVALFCLHCFTSPLETS